MCSKTCMPKRTISSGSLFLLTVLWVWFSGCVITIFVRLHRLKNIPKSISSSFHLRFRYLSNSLLSRLPSVFSSFDGPVRVLWINIYGTFINNLERFLFSLSSAFRSNDARTEGRLHPPLNHQLLKFPFYLVLRIQLSCSNNRKSSRWICFRLPAYRIRLTWELTVEQLTVKFEFFSNFILCQTLYINRKMINKPKEITSSLFVCDKLLKWIVKRAELIITLHLTKESNVSLSEIYFWNDTFKQIEFARVFICFIFTTVIA